MEQVSGDEVAVPIADAGAADIADLAVRRNTTTQRRELRETAKLVDDLARALKTQGGHVQEAVGRDHPAKAIAADLARDAAAASDNARLLIEELQGAAGGEPADASGSAPVTGLAPVPNLAPAATARSASRARANGRAPVEDSARTLALELKMEGARRDDVERFLRDSFAVTDAGTVVDEVYGRL